MTKNLLGILLTCLFHITYSQTIYNESLSLKPQKTSSNPNLVYLDGQKTFNLPADGAFLYSSLNGDLGVVSSGYSNNEDYTITIKNQYNRKIFLRSNYFLTEGSNDVLKIYDGQDTSAHLLKVVSGVLDQNFLILSSGEYLTLRFRSDNSGTSKGFRFRLDNGAGVQNKPAPPLPTPMACASTPAADECASAPLICDLNGYCGNTSGAYTAGNTSGLGNFCGSIENNSWLSFVASSTSASLIFNSAGCQDNSSGIQAVIYASSNCSSFTEVSNCESQGSGSGTFTISTNVNLVPGQTYYVMVDGFAGNICSYTVTAGSGVALGQQITGPSQLCPGFSGTLTCSSPAPSYTWTSNPAGVYPNSQSISISPTVTTTYSLTLPGTACVPTGTTIVKTVTVTNTLNPANITAPNPICMGSTITLASLTNGGTYAWTGPSSYTANTQNATVSNWSAANNGLYSLVITYGPGCATSPATVNLTGSPTPTINISAAPSLTICNGQNVVLTSSGGTGTNGYIWDWDLFQPGLTVTTQFCISIPFVGIQCNPSPLSIPGIGAGPSATIATTQNTQICASSENAAGCIGKKCVNIVVLPAAGNLTVSATPTICPGQATTLTVSGGTTYTWSPAATLSSANGATVTASPTITTTYSVSSPACGGSTTTRTLQVIVNGTPPNIGAINGPTNVCSNQTGVTYSVSNVASTNYTWSVPAGATITSAPTNSNSITVNFGSSAGTVSVSAASTCGTATASLTVNLNPSLSLTVTPNNSSICAGGSVTLTASGATNYTWSPSASLSSANGSSVTANPVITTTYSILGATGTCTGSTTATVTINSALSLSVTPNNPVICPAGQANLVASGATTYTWSGSNLNTTSGASVTASPIVTTIYTITGSAGTCTGVATATVTVDNTNCNTGTCDVTQIRAALTAAGNIELLGMNDPCSLYFINPQYMTGPAAQAYAQTFGANLISVQSAAENVSLITALSNQGYAAEVVWIGFGDDLSEGNFTWYDGAPVSYTNWNAAEPNNAGGNENCTQIYPDGTWNDLNCAGYNSLSVIEVNLCPQVSIANVPIHCANTNVILTASTLLGSPNYTYTWSQSGAETFTNVSTPGNTNEISVTSVGPNTFTVTSVDRYSCQQFTTINLSVNPTPTITANSSSICLGQQTATLTANGATDYTWTPSSSLSSANGNIVTANPTVSTIYTIQGSSAGCTGTQTVSVNVNFPPNIYIIQKNSLCDTTILNWFDVTSVTPTLAQGSLPSGITFNATHSGGGMSTTPSMFSGGTFPVTYSVPIGATTIRNDLGGTFNFCFNQPVINPQIAFASIGTTGVPITINTSVPYQVIWPGVSMTYPTPTTLIGEEGYTIIRFPGIHTCVALDYIGNESYCNLAFGVMDSDCQGIPICPGDPVELIANGASSYLWSNGASTSTIAPTPTVTTTYSVGGMNSAGCVNTSTTTVVVNPTPTITAISNVTICPAGSATLSASGGNTYTWSPAASLNSANATTVTSTPSITTNYTVSGTDLAGCVASNTVEVVVANNPTITISPNVTVCPLAATTLTAGGATSYSWTPNTFLNNDNTSNVISTPSTSTIYTVTGLLGICSSTNEVTVTVTNTVVVNASASNPTICPNGSTTLTATGATSYTWSPALTLNTANGSTVTAMPLADETYTVIGATSTCTNSAQVVITVTTNPVVSATNATICAGSSGTLTASGANSYTWSPATFLIPTTGASVTANPLSTKTYTVIGTSPLGCLGSTTAKVDVIPMPNLSITANPLSICPGDFSALTAFGASNFTWSPAATLSNTTGANTSASPTITTTYTLDGSNGVSPYLCLSTKTIQVIVKPTTTITVGTPAPICFGSYTSLDAHGGNMYNWQPSTGISHPNDSVVTVSPNVNTIYTVTVNKPGFCANTATVEVIVNPLPYVYAGIDTIVNIDEAVTLTGTGNTSVGFLSPDSYPLNCNLCPVITVNPQENTCFVLKGTSADGCTNFDTVCVVITKDWNVYIPNAFTPNNDGYNDLFIPYGYGIEKIQMTIFDRWGAVVFNSDDEHKGWDGKYKGTMCPQGIYVYQITVTSMGGASMKKVGHVTLLPLLK